MTLTESDVRCLSVGGGGDTVHGYHHSEPYIIRLSPLQGRVIVTIVSLVVPDYKLL